MSYAQTAFLAGFAAQYDISRTLTNSFDTTYTRAPYYSTIEVTNQNLLNYVYSNVVRFNDTLTYDNVNWVGNFRDGTKAQIIVSNTIGNTVNQNML